MPPRDDGLPTACDALWGVGALAVIGWALIRTFLWMLTLNTGAKLILTVALLAMAAHCVWNDPIVVAGRQRRARVRRVMRRWKRAAAWN
jgi:hypothetical protein